MVKLQSLSSTVVLRHSFVIRASSLVIPLALHSSLFNLVFRLNSVAMTSGLSALGKSAMHQLKIRAGAFILFSCLVLPHAQVQAKPPPKTEVVIVGAGLSGLAAAYELKKAHVPYHILELAPRVGGRVR